MKPAESRYHALDNLRAILMWLGIVLHACMAYMVHASQAPWRDVQLSRGADLVVALIHSFRMPAFFIVAGFLAGMLLQRRGPREFLVHRAKRLALPLAVFWPFLWGAIWLSASLFMNRIVLGRWGFDGSALPAGTMGPSHTFHLWFLWVLFWLCVLAALCALLPRGPFAAAGRLLARAGRAWWGVVPLTLPLVLVALAWGYPYGMLQTTGEFLLPWTEWVHNGLFFAFGLAMWSHRGEMLPHYAQHWKRYAWAGLLVFLFFGAGRNRPELTPDWYSSSTYNALAWLWSFASIGAALNVLDKRNEWLAYLADSAYWVYLVHMPLTILWSALMFQAPMPVVAKVVLNIVLTTAVCLASYEAFVRHTWIGLMLNGKRQPRRGAPPAAMASAG